METQLTRQQNCFLDVTHYNNNGNESAEQAEAVKNPSLVPGNKNPQKIPEVAINIPESFDQREEEKQMANNQPIFIEPTNETLNKFKIDIKTDIEGFGKQQVISLAEKRRVVRNDQLQHCHFNIIWRNLNYFIQPKWYKLPNKTTPPTTTSCDGKQILNDLSGSLKSGQLTAVLGPSGAGKSTLIDCLLGKKTNGLSGQTRVSFENRSIEKERRKRRPLKIATIPQKDHLLDTLTVEETLMFASRIKNANSTDDELKKEDLLIDSKEVLHRQNGKSFNHEKNVQKVHQMLNLNSCASTRCGKLSGGQYKRVSIGQELLSRPDILILDEPTSGLDSVACFKTVEVLRELVESSDYPLAILAVIHQPDIEVFSLFHKVYVLKSEGKAIYEGKSSEISNTVDQAINMIESKQFVDCSEIAQLRLLQERFLNPAKMILELASGKYGSEITDCLCEIVKSSNSSDELIFSVEKKTNDFSHNLKGSTKILKDLNKLGDETIKPIKVNSNKNTIITRKESNFDRLLCIRTSNESQKRCLKVFIEHISAHTGRSWKTILRDPILFLLQLILHIIVPILLSYMFQNRRKGDGCPILGSLDVVEEAYSNGTTLDDLQNEMRSSIENIGFLYFEIHAIAMTATCITSLTYPLVMRVLIREYKNGWYSISSYFIGRTLADIPLPILNTFIAIGSSYYLTNQPRSLYEWRFLSITLLTILATLIGQTTGLIFGAIFMKKPQSAVFAAPVGTIPLTLVSGFLIRVNSLPFVLRIIAKLSYFTHLMNGVIVSRYGFNKCSCNDEDDFNNIESSHIIPDQARKFINIWIESFSNEFHDDSDEIRVENALQTTATTMLPNSTSIEMPNIDLVEKLVNTISKFKTFGYQMTNCQQVKPFNMLDYELEDSDLLPSYLALIIMVVVFRLLAYLVLTWRIRSSF